MKTKQKILIRALELFNNDGIEYTSLLKMGEPLELTSGHISAHFPKKEDLINRLALQFSEKNNVLWNTKQALDYKSFFDLLKNYFYLQLEYRCLFISMAHLHTHQPEIAERTKKEELQRKKIIKASMNEMMENGELKKISPTQIDFLTNTILLILKSWISEAIISFPKKNEKAQIKFFLELIEGVIMCDKQP